MDRKQRNYNGKSSITELIDDAINNALVRRNQAIDSQDTLSALSNEEATKVVGGCTTTGIISTNEYTY